MPHNSADLDLIKFLSLADNDSNLGSEIKNIVKSIYCKLNLFIDIQSFVSPSGSTVAVDKEMIVSFYNKYCIGQKAIKDNIYYKINFEKNNYDYFTVERDLEKSPRNIIKSKPNKIYKATYEEEINKNPDFIANYYSKKYSISNKDNIITVMNEDDVMCLDCGCISDERLSVVPNRDIHLKNMKCPRCGSISSSLVTFNKRLHKLSTLYRDSE